MPLFRLKTLPLLLGTAFAILFSSCQHGFVYGPDVPPRAVIRDGIAITLRDQKLSVIRNGEIVRDYDISSSKFGIGARNGSHYTPTGVHAVAKKVGDGQPIGMVFKHCRPTGEVVAVNAAGRDPIVTRVIQIAGVEGQNSNSFNRRIYIHGTPEERNIGRPASYGCIRMRSRDVIDLYPRVQRGTPVVIETCSQEKYMQAENDATSARIEIPQEVVAALPTDDVARPRRSSRRASGRRLSSSRRAVASGKKSAPRSNGRAVASSGKGKSTKKNAPKKKSSKGRKVANTRRKK